MSEASLQMNIQKFGTKVISKATSDAGFQEVDYSHIHVNKCTE